MLGCGKSKKNLSDFHVESCLGRSRMSENDESTDTNFRPMEHELSHKCECENPVKKCAWEKDDFQTSVIPTGTQK